MSQSLDFLQRLLVPLPQTQPLPDLPAILGSEFLQELRVHPEVSAVLLVVLLYGLPRPEYLLEFLSLPLAEES